MPPRLPARDFPCAVLKPALRLNTNPILKDSIYMKVYSAESNGEYSGVDIKVAPGGGTPFHYHNTYNESFKARNGDLTLFMEDTKTGKVLENVLKPGQSATVPKGVMHRFHNGTKGEIEFYGELRPGHAGFEKTLHIMYGLARDGQVDAHGLPKGIAVKALMQTMGDIDFAGWKMTLGRPFMKLLSAWCRWTGEEERLLRRYWGFSDGKGKREWLKSEEAKREHGKEQEVEDMKGHSA